MEQKTLRLQNFAAIQKDGNGVLGKVLYYSLSNILIDKEKFSELCQSIGFPYQPTRRTALADAFRSATGDIYERMVLKTDSGPTAWRPSGFSICTNAVLGAGSWKHCWKTMWIPCRRSKSPEGTSILSLETTWQS